MDHKQFHPILYDGYNYLLMLGLMLIHVSKRAPGIATWTGHKITGISL